MGEVAVVAIGHGELVIAAGQLGIARQRRAQQADRLVPILGLVHRHQALRQHHLDQRRGMGQLHRAAQRRDRLGGAAAFQQRLALELVEIGIGRLALDQPVDLADGVAQPAVAIGGDGARIARRQARGRAADSGATPCPAAR